MDSVSVISFVVFALLVRNPEFIALSPSKKARVMLFAGSILLVSSAFLLSPSQLGLAIAALGFAVFSGLKPNPVRRY